MAPMPRIHVFHGVLSNYMHVSKPDAAGFTSNAGRALQIPQNPMTSEYCVNCNIFISVK